MRRLRDAYFAQTIICFPSMFLPIGGIFLPVQSKEDHFWNPNFLSSVLSLTVVFYFCFYCRECRQNASFAL